MEDDWGLQAVVRGCTTTTTSTTTTSCLNSVATTTSCFTESCLLPPPPPPPQLDSENTNTNSNNNNLFAFPDLFQPRKENSIEDLLQHFYQPSPTLQKSQKPPPTSHTIPISPLSVLGGLHEQASSQQVQAKQVHGKQSFGGSRTQSQNTRPKKRKNQLKRVCQVPAEGLSCDVWSWRKYGQKPIKGSPYPRGYYRCSTTKGCLARKQVERNRSDPGMFTVTFTGEHNHPMPSHRNALAGIPRNKPDNPDDPPASPSGKMDEKEEGNVSPTTSFSPASISDVGVTDDFFDGLEEFVGNSAGECFSEDLLAGADFFTDG